MTAITISDLQNAALDAKTIKDVATSTLPTITDRLGNVKQTVSAAVESLKSFVNRGTRVVGTTYQLKDVFYFGGAWYVTVSAHVASADFNADALYVRVYQGVLTRVSMLEKGAAGNATTDDVTPIAASISSAGLNGVVETSGQTSYVSSFSNPLGIKFIGGGNILIPATQGGNYAATSYADEGQMVVGREYLYRLFLRLKVGGNLTGFIYGDSTAAMAANGGGYAGAANEPQVLLSQLLQNRRVKNNIVLTNRAIGGTRVSQMTAMPDIDQVTGTTDLFVIKYGINDSQDGVSVFANNLRTKLAEIRANGYGTVQNLTIVLVGPNATFDPQHGRSSTWYEKIRGIYVQAARDYQCMFVDTYAYLRDMSWASTYLQDNAFGNLQGVHPLDIMQRWIWAFAAESMIRPGDLIDYSGTSGALIPLGGWVAYGNGFAAPTADFDRAGYVNVHGLIKSGTVANGQAIAQLPSAIYFPSSIEMFEVTTSTGRCSLRINPNGNIEQQDGNASATYTSLSGIRFKPA